MQRLFGQVRCGGDAGGIGGRVAVAIAVACALVGVTPDRSSAQSGGFAITSVSARAGLVTGGDVLLRIAVPGGVGVGGVRVTLNGTDVTSMFRRDDANHALVGLVTGLAPGSNTVSVWSGPSNGAAGAELTVVNHPIVGPVFSGPHEVPFICETEQFELQSGETLGAALDANCSIARRVDYYYRSTDGGDLKPLPAMTPSDMADVTVSGGATVPYIVRIETGTINRAIYQIAILHDPGQDADPDFATPPSGWNGSLLYTFGGGCEPGWYRQGASTAGVDDDAHLVRGYAVASASLDVGGNNCYNDALSAETMMMVKEHFIETYGEPLYTVGWGTSGGSIQQQLIAQNYPGLLDGLILGRSFADGQFASSTTSGEARILAHYFDERAAVEYTDEQKRQIAGFGNLATLDNLARLRAPRFAANEECPDVLPAAQRYDPATNPEGARCNLWDHTVHVYGRDPATGFARRPLDNVGVQYGLAVLESGDIATEQFLDLNEKIGGFDIDGNLVAERMVADPAATDAAYRTGRVNGGGVATVPILDYRTYYDDLPRGDVHLRFQSFATRARMEAANGHSDNLVMLHHDRRYGAFSTTSPVLREGLDQLGEWLTALATDASSDTPETTLRRTKPAGLVDACWTSDEVPTKIVERLAYQSGRCDEIYPAFSYPRGVAGSPIAGDIIKCQLKPVDPADYGVSFTAEEMARLRAIFPEGVCDWSKPGVGQQPLAGTWLSFGGDEH
ncbi:MAG: DUF6351 family protein [Acidobacteria bacterium]|nr:DUF6351 family protein [Acidobacteriota bacterium]